MEKSNFMNKEFSITFWIRINNNPKWTDRFSDIDFPPITTNEGIQLYFSKRKETFVVYVLHPIFGYRKIFANIKKYLHKDAFIALTNSDKETKLYVNADLVKTTKINTIKDKIEIGDYVMLELKQGDSSKLLSNNISIIAPARIVSFDEENVTADLITVGEIVKVSKEQIKV